MALATAFAQHGNAATLFSLLLLSCAAELRDKSGPNGKLIALPDWNAISEVDPRIKSHPLFPKTVGYHQQTSPITPPVAPQLPSPLTPTSTTLAAPTPVTPSPVTPTPTIAIVPSGKLFVPGNGKRKAPMPDDNNNIRESRVHLNKVKSIPTIDDDDDEDPPADSVIVVKNKTTSAAPKANNLDAPKLLTPKDDALRSTERLFGIRCKQCIKDDASCIVILRKKLGEKKIWCTHLTEQEAAALLAEVTIKRANKKTWTVKRTRSQVCNTTHNTTFAPAADPVDVALPESVPSTSNHVDNNVNVDFTVEQPAPTSPAPVIWEVTPELPAPQPSNLDIIQSINAMHQDFAGLLQVSRNHVEVVCREVNICINEVEDRLMAR
ncbi:hypothetical protein EDD22DRAFT_950411 [Suillus occidentalis]|nr:hypothetical protein EDD22DRAFT_950411 [Suillus occidentalis]